MASRSRALATRVLHRTLEILAESEGYVPRGDVVARVGESLTFSDWESAPAGKSGNPRWRNAFWYTANAKFAGLMIKARGQWKITEAGRRALADMSPADLFTAAEEGYREWREHEESGEAGLSEAHSGTTTRGHILRDGLLHLLRASNRTLDRAQLILKVRSGLPEEMLEALEAHDPDWETSYGYATFARAARAGWVQRNFGQWTLTDAGARALEEWPQPVELWRKAKHVAGTSDEPEQVPYLGNVSDLRDVPQALYRSQTATIAQLVADIEQGTLALPDIQRPFVWKNTKVRDLLDSLFRGYPFGFILTWRSPVDVTTKAIGGSSTRTAIPHALVIDGQQRLTSLYAVMTGSPVVDDKFRKRQIRIAFHPLQGRFGVADVSTKRNPEWIDDVSVIYTERMGALSIVRSYLERLKVAREITPDHERTIEGNIERLVNLRNLGVNVLEIGTEAEEEQVAEIFVRINSKGQNLRQADFILTLLAVFWEEGREALEEFSKSCYVPSADGSPSPFNHKLRPGPDQLVRVGVAVGHRRARLSAAYQVLRGKDPQTGSVTDEAREQNIGRLAEAQTRILNVNNWHEFLKILSSAGYRHKRLMQSTITALYAYSLFLIGREDLGVSLNDLRRVIGRWYTMSVITARYVGGNTETMMEEDLARLRGVESSSEFMQILEDAMAAELTNDFWAVTLPSRLESSDIRTLGSFFAAQSVLGAKALYSSLLIAELLDPSMSSTKEDLEVHHLFPKAWLRKNGFGNPREFNQVANMALLEWSANIEVSDSAPGDYAPRLEGRIPDGDVERAYRLTALPTEWWKMEYPEFLARRRELMAGLIREGYESLGKA